MDPGWILGREDRALGVGADDHELRLLLLQVARRARDRAARPDRDHDGVELVSDLLPELRAGRPVVGLRIRVVRVLVRLERAGNLLGEAVGDGVVALRRVGVDGCRADHDLGAEGTKERDLLGRDLVGNDADQLVALDRGGQRESDAGVAGGRLDDRPARLQLPVAFRRLHHAQSDPVLVRAARVQVLELCEQDAAELGAQLLEAYDRCLPDQLEQRGKRARHAG